MSNGINTVLMQLAEAATKRKDGEKQAFVPMPGGAPGGAPPMGPAMTGGAPPAGGGAPPMGPAMTGGAPPAGGGAPPMDPMAMAATGADPAAILAAGGAPVDPMMAAAGGAAGVPAAPPAGAETAPPAEGTRTSSKGGGQKEKLDEIHNMLTKIMGVLVGKGLLDSNELGDLMGAQAGAQAGMGEQPQGGVPAEQKIASEEQKSEEQKEEPEKVGSVVEDKGEDVTIPAEQAGQVKNALAGLILSLGGNKS